MAATTIDPRPADNVDGDKVMLVLKAIWTAFVLFAVAGCGIVGIITRKKILVLISAKVAYAFGMVALPTRAATSYFVTETKWEGRLGRFWRVRKVLAAIKQVAYFVTDPLCRTVGLVPGTYLVQPNETRKAYEARCRSMGVKPKGRGLSAGQQDRVGLRRPIFRKASQSVSVPRNGFTWDLTTVYAAVGCLLLGMFFENVAEGME